MSVIGLGAVLLDYTLACTGVPIQITKATDAAGVVLDSTGLQNIWSAPFPVQNSNQSGAEVFLTYKTSAPVTLDKTFAGTDLAAGQTSIYPEKRLTSVERGDQVNLKNVWVNGPAGSYLHFSLPGRA